MIESFFFGKKGAIGFYHPSADPSSTKLLVICPPFFDEYQRSYRALADLGNACSSHPRGIHVLRIDYYGTGEAQGVLEDVTVDDWIDDIDSAIEEGIALAGAEEVILMGVRFGATLAAQCQHSAIVSYIFWDPMDYGKEFLQWIDHHNDLLACRHKKLAKQVNHKLEDIPYVCFEVSQTLKKGIDDLSIQELYARHADKVWVTTTDKKVMESGRYKNCVFNGYEYDWPIFHDGNLIPKPVLESIVKKVLP